jgi:hypothetical protein
LFNTLRNSTKRLSFQDVDDPLWPRREHLCLAKEQTAIINPCNITPFFLHLFIIFGDVVSEFSVEEHLNLLLFFLNNFNGR